jgi:hypothetical protein
MIGLKEDPQASVFHEADEEVEEPSKSHKALGKGVKRTDYVKINSMKFLHTLKSIELVKLASTKFNNTNSGLIMQVFLSQTENYNSPEHSIQLSKGKIRQCLRELGPSSNDLLD